MTIKFEQLEVGMLTDVGLIVRIGEAGTDKFWGNERYIAVFDLNDSYYGVGCRLVRADEEFEILHPPGCKEYKDVIEKLISERVNGMNTAQTDVDLLHAYLRIGPEKPVGA